MNACVNVNTFVCGMIDLIALSVAYSASIKVFVRLTVRRLFYWLTVWNSANLTRTLCDNSRRHEASSASALPADNLPLSGCALSCPSCQPVSYIIILLRLLLSLPYPSSVTFLRCTFYFADIILIFACCHIMQTDYFISGVAPFGLDQQVRLFLITPHETIVSYVFIRSN